MEGQRYRFAGTKPYTESENDIFFGRESEIQDLFNIASLEKIGILHSEPKIGKTSLLRAGLIPILKNSGQFEIIYLKFERCVKKKETPIGFIKCSLSVYSDSGAYIDKVLIERNTIWCYLKKLQAKIGIKKNIIFIFDNFENFFTYPDEQREKFNIELSSILYEPIPSKTREEIKNSLTENKDLLTSKGSELLYAPLKLKVFFSIRTGSLHKLQKLEIFYPDIKNNIYELEKIHEDKADLAITLASQFKSKYEDMNNFKANIFEFSADSKNKIVNFLKDDNDRINPYELQIVCNYAEKLVINRKEKSINNNNFSNIGFIFDVYFKKAIAELPDAKERNKISELIENELVIEDRNTTVPVYEELIKSKYKLNPNSFDKLNGLITCEINDKGELERKLSSNKFIPAVLHAKNERVKQEEKKEVEIVEVDKLKQEAVEHFNKSKKIRVVSIISIAAFIVAVLGIILINNLRKKAKQSKAFAESSLYAAYSFQELDKDPTTSFRFAETAYNKDNQNPAAFSALINAYYSTEAFYTVIGNTDEQTQSARLSKNGEYIISVVRNKKDKLFYVRIATVEGEEMFEIEHKTTITNIGFSKDNKYIKFGDRKGNIYLYNLKGKKINEYNLHQSAIWTIKFSNDKTKILSSGGDQNLFLYNTEDKTSKKLTEHNFDIYATGFSPNGQLIASADDNTINISSINGELLKTIAVPKRKSYYFPLVQTLKFTANSKKILVVINDMAGRNHIAKIIDIEGNEKMLFRGHTEWINTIDISKDGKKIVTSGRDNTVRVWKIDGELIGELKGHKANVSDAKFGENSNTIITVSDDKTIRKWRFGRLLNPLAEIPDIKYASFSPDGLKIVTANNSAAKLLNLTGEVETEFAGNKKKINHLSFSSNGKYIVSSGSDKTARVWDMNGKEINVFESHRQRVNTAVFMPDSNIVITASKDSTIILWEIGSNAPVDIIKTEAQVNSAAFSPDGKSFITAESSGDVILRDIKGKTIIVLEGHTDVVLKAEFSADGKHIISVSKDKTAKLWDTEGNLIHTFSGYNNKLNSACFSADGKYILIAGNENKVMLYDISGKEIAEFEHKGKVLNAQFSPDGKYILTIISLGRKNIAKLQVISPEKILELTNEVKIFGEF